MQKVLENELQVLSDGKAGNLGGKYEKPGADCGCSGAGLCLHCHCGCSGAGLCLQCHCRQFGVLYDLLVPCETEIFLINSTTFSGRCQGNAQENHFFLCWGALQHEPRQPLP